MAYLEDINIGDRVKFKYGWKDVREGVVTAKFVCADSEVRDWIGNELYTICGYDKCVDYILSSSLLPKREHQRYIQM